MDGHRVPQFREYPARGRAQVPNPQPPNPHRRGSLFINGTIALIGALAAAITAVLALRPLDREDFARFTTVTITSGVSYSEYQQRSVPPHPVSQSLGQDHAIKIAALAHPRMKETAGAKVKDETTTSPTSPAPGPTNRKADSPGATSRPTTAPTATGRLLNWPPLTADDSLRLAPLDRVPPTALPRVIPRVSSACAQKGITGCQALGEELSQLPFTDVHGKSLTEAEAAAEMVDVMKNSRTTSAGKGKRQLVGAVVDVNLELSGLRGKTMRLSWSLWREGGATQIYRAWLNDNLAYELKASSDHDSAGLNFWIPLPKGKGPYFVRSKLMMDGLTLATVDSEPIR